MRDTTDEFSFVLKPGAHGVGVFATHDIKSGTYLRLFGDFDETVVRKKEEVPEWLWDFCIDWGTHCLTPKDFGHMQIGWYLNHAQHPTAKHDGYDEAKEYYRWFASRDLNEGEEITVDYNTLSEPLEAKEAYYNQG